MRSKWMPAPDMKLDCNCGNCLRSIRFASTRSNSFKCYEPKVEVFKDKFGIRTVRVTSLCSGNVHEYSDPDGVLFDRQSCEGSDDANMA